MLATIVDLRYKMRDVLKALARNEQVTILYHGQEKGIIVPITERKRKKKVKDHPFFGMKRSKQPVDVLMNSIRGGRYNDL